LPHKKQALKNVTNEIEKDEIETSLNKHLEFANDAREYYKFENVQAAKLSNPNEFTTLSFDWAKNWELPRYLDQPSDLYFLSRQKDWNLWYCE